MKKFIITGTIAGSLLFSGNALAADYTVKLGDSLWKVATAHDVTVANLKSWNNLSSDTIYPGQVLKINTTTSGSSTYVVVKGDTFSGIAKKFNMSTSALQALNPQITNINLIKIGQVINVSGSSSSGSSSSSQKTYVVVKGDTFSGIAKKFNMSLSELQALNPQITNISLIKVGQVINISDNSSSSSWETKADAIIATGKKYLGAKYLYGASTTQTDAFDCSSFTMRVFSENGITLPRNSVAQSQVGQSISLSNVRKGDLIFFDTDYDGTINHVGIAIDSTTMIHCGTSTGVAITTLNSYWNPRVAKVTRVF